MEAIKLAFADTRTYVADPRYMKTKVSELLEYCGAKDSEKVLYGGPMMGMALYDTEPRRRYVHNNNALV